MSDKAKGNILLFLTAMIWGMGFVAQKAGAELAPFTYNGIRMTMGGLVLLPVILLFSKDKSKIRDSIKGGIVCGIVLAVASNLQQFGIYFETDASKAGFITSLYILFVPLLSIVLGKKVRGKIWGCVALGAAGFYLLTMAGRTGGFTLEKGDFFILLCALVFAAHILVIDHYGAKADGIILSSVQFLVAGAISLFCMSIFETPQMSQIISLWQPLLFSGVMSSGVAYTMQVLGQKKAEPTTATLIMSLESVFAVIFGILLLKEKITILEGIGCIVIFVAVIIPQLPEKVKVKEHE